jgi:hypothetical protein
VVKFFFSFRLSVYPENTLDRFICDLTALRADTMQVFTCQGLFYNADNSQQHTTASAK